MKLLYSNEIITTGTDFDSWEVLDSFEYLKDFNVKEGLQLYDYRYEIIEDELHERINNVIYYINKLHFRLGVR